MSGPANAASEDLAAPIKGNPVAEIHSQSKRKPDAENHSEGYEKPVTESEIEQVPEIPSRNETQSERDPVSEIHFTNKREPIAQIPSKSKQVKESAPDIPSTSKGSKGEPRLKEILTESERDSHADSDDGQQRLPGPSLYGKKPRRWNSQQEWVDYIKEDLHVRPTSRSDATIFKIPNLLKDTKREAYVPQRVSLGPYHHGSAELSANDHYKRIALRKMMTNFNQKWDLHVNDDTFAKNAWNRIVERENKIRCSYGDSFYCAPNTLAGMLCLDGCFILDVLKSLGTGMINNPIFGENRVAAFNTLKDILMLENQIPWIVLLELLQLEDPTDNDARMTLLNVMVNVTRGLFNMSSEDRTDLLEPSWLKSANKEFHHLLGFVHKVIVYRPAGQAKGERRISIQSCIGRWFSMALYKKGAMNYDFESIPTAIELKNVGIKFRPCNGGIQEIRFEWDSSTIYLPMLSITYYTEILFRNLIAFEMCKLSEINYVCSYANLMDNLINSQNDAAFLKKRGILINSLMTDKEVADLFNGLFKGVTMGMPNMFDELRLKVNAKYKNKIRTRVQLPELLQDHFSSPWKTLAVAVAFAILCLTLIQTIYTVKN